MAGPSHGAGVPKSSIPRWVKAFQRISSLEKKPLAQGKPAMAQVAMR